MRSPGQRATAESGPGHSTCASLLGARSRPPSRSSSRFRSEKPVKVPARLFHVAVFGLLPLLSACVFSVGGSSCSWGTIQGSGVEATEHRSVAEFTRVQIDGSTDLVARAG